MAGDDNEYVYDEASGEWRPAAEVAAAAAAQAQVRDASGNVLADGDSVTLIKDLKVKGANQTLKQGTIIRSIRSQLLTLPPETVVHTGHGDSTTIGDEAPHLEEWLRRGQ